MCLPDTIVLDVSNLLTLAGVVVAVLAALYSARSAQAAQRQAKAAEEQSQHARSALSESKRQNRIASHGHQLEAFKALLAFRSQITSVGVGFKREAIWSLWEYVQIAEFYFSEPLAKKLDAIVRSALDLQAAHEEWKEDGSSLERKAKIEATHAQFRKLRADVEAAEDLMRAELRLVENED